MINGILQHTPIWVFVVFAVLLFLGMQAARPRRVRLLRILITPAIFIIWGIVSLTSKHDFSILLLADWLVAAILAATLATSIVRFPALRADHQRQIVYLPGSPLPLVRNIVIFATKYALAVAAATAPAASGQIAYWDVGVSGICVGYFLGWLGRLMMAYRHAPTLEESAPASPSSALPGGAS
jgi:hypothetical protein